MPVNHISDYIVINQGGTPGTAGTGAYFVASLADVFNPALSSAASADPLTLTAFEGSIVWHSGAPFIWNGTAYEAVRAAGAAVGDDARVQVSATAPTLRADGSALVAGDLWSDTVNDVLMIYDGAAYVAVGGGGNSTIVDNGDNTITHTSGSGAVVTLMKAPTHVAGPAAPSAPYLGDTWYDTVNSKLFQRANNGTTDIWVDITASAAGSGLDPRLQSGATAPLTRADGAPLADGDLWYDTTADALKTYESGAWQGGGSAVRSFPDPSQTQTLPVSGGTNGAFVWADFTLTGGSNYQTTGTVAVNGSGGWIRGLELTPVVGTSGFSYHRSGSSINMFTSNSSPGIYTSQFEIYIPPGGNLTWNGTTTGNLAWTNLQTSLIRGGSL